MGQPINPIKGHSRLIKMVLIALPIVALMIGFNNCSGGFHTPFETSKQGSEQPLSNSQCSFNGEAVNDGASVTAYLSSTGACQSESRACNSGTLSGSFQYASCSANGSQACLFNGVTVTSGNSINAFQNSTVPSGQSCASESRTCKDGALSGSYAYGNCEVGKPAACLFNGQSIASGSSVTAYQSSTVPFAQTCLSETRACINGSLSGSNQFASCVVNGPAACLFNAMTIASGNSVVAYQSSTVPYGQTCASEPRSCQNGNLSGTFPFASCAVGQPAACLFNGQTIASGASVAAFQSSTVPFGQTCVSEMRLCGNGQLSGSYSFSSCKVDPAAASNKNGSISSGVGHTCIVTPVGGVKCMGLNFYGEFGNGTTSTTFTGTLVDTGITGVAAIAAGDRFTCALTTIGGVKCWGAIGSSPTGSTFPVDTGLTDIVAITAGGLHACALTKTGGVKCWGYNRWGQLGNNSTTESAVPVDTGLADIAAIEAGGNSSCALTKTGAVKCWGDNHSFCQVGNNSLTDSIVPVDIGLTGIVAITEGRYHTCALTAVGGIKCWGRNNDYQYGNVSSGSCAPVDTGLTGYSQISAGGFHTCGITNSGNLKCWGSNGSGQLGKSPLEVGNYPVGPVDTGQSDVAALATGGAVTCVLTKNGDFKCWGY